MVGPSAVLAHLNKEYSKVLASININPEITTMHKDYAAKMKSIVALRMAARSLRLNYNKRRITKEILTNVHAVSDEFVNYEKYLGYTVEVAVPLLGKHKVELKESIETIKAENPELVALFDQADDLLMRMRMVNKERGRLSFDPRNNTGFRVNFLASRLFGFGEWNQLTYNYHNLEYLLLFKEILLNLVGKSGLNKDHVEKYFDIVTDNDFEEMSEEEMKLYASLHESVDKTPEYRVSLVNQWYDNYNMKVIDLVGTNPLHKELFESFKVLEANRLNKGIADSYRNQIAELTNSIEG